jgi:hypothetical protein
MNAIPMAKVLPKNIISLSRNYKLKSGLKQEVVFIRSPA